MNASIDRATESIITVVGRDNMSPEAKIALKALITSVYAAGATDASLKRLHETYTKSVRKFINQE